ncbi:uncharacterized protein LOC129756107 [Uranotaenia lowii]|uniref:uncharacterized protein LOC129756107 n=1 Tax=Uranotaenia lowii TaxID=190385 RepID=UPI00247A84CF|nr:uncharacterized protein LOC129756107 [Uranotaenia lowii]
MKTSLSNILLIATASAALVIGCEHPTSHYKTMKCKPSCQKSSDGCPASYSCPTLKNPAADKCYWAGKEYSIGDDIPSNETYGGCIAAVSCIDTFESGEARFIYASIDCPEFFQRIPGHCIRQYNPRSCCSRNVVCNETDIQQLATCTIGGKTYKEGQQMEIPNQPCKSCICAPGFDENHIDDNPNCYEAQCFFEIYDEEKVYGGGIPVYSEANFCCPIFWRLPEPTDTAVRGNQASSTSQQCQYGNLTLNVGDSLEPFSDATGVYYCECAIPPLAHCIVAFV